MNDLGCVREKKRAAQVVFRSMLLRTRAGNNHHSPAAARGRVSRHFGVLRPLSVAMAPNLPPRPARGRESVRRPRPVGTPTKWYKDNNQPGILVQTTIPLGQNVQCRPFERLIVLFPGVREDIILPLVIHYIVVSVHCRCRHRSKCIIIL